MKGSALVVVDMLYDFIDGSMACKGAPEAIGKTLEFIDRKTSTTVEGEDLILDRYPIMFVRDFHPSDHCSFQEQGGPWPAHCVQGTRGAEVHGDLEQYLSEEFSFFKGYRKDLEQYSGFEGMNEAGQTLGEVLDIMDLRNVYVCGIATEYCVQETCLDLMKAGFTVYLLKDCLAYVDYEAHLKTLALLQKEGIRLVDK